MTDFKVEALSILGNIHRTFTLANSREHAHSMLKDYHEGRFQKSMNKFHKAMSKADKAPENSTKQAKFAAIAHAHLQKAESHKNSYINHATKEFNASEEGYEHHAEMRRKANNAAFDFHMAKSKNTAAKPVIPTITKPKPQIKAKNPIVPSHPKIITPVETPGLKSPLEKSLAPNPPKIIKAAPPKRPKSGGGLRSAVKPAIVKTPPKTKVTPPPKPQKISKPPKPAVIKPKKITAVKPVVAKPPKIKASPKLKAA